MDGPILILKISKYTFRWHVVFMITICVSLEKQDLTSFSLSTTSDFDLSKQKSKDLPYIKAHQIVLKAKKYFKNHIHSKRKQNTKR